MDKLTKEHRSWNMSRIKNRDTKPEVIVRSVLHRLGYRFRLHRNDLPGKPDIVMPKHKAVVLIHGCFWHRHARCKLAYTPKSNCEFWESKFVSNMKRDRVVRRLLKKAGWRIILIWECQTNDHRKLAERLGKSLSVDDR